MMVSNRQMKHTSPYAEALIGSTCGTETVGESKREDSILEKKGESGITERNGEDGFSGKTGTFWTEEETIELLRLGRSEIYREKVTGKVELDWDVIGKYLGRGARAAQRKFANMQDVELAQSEEGDRDTLVLVRPPNDGKKWSDQEVLELLNLGDPSDDSFRLATLGTREVDWGLIAKHFGRSRNVVSSKFSYEGKNRTAYVNGTGGPADKGGAPLVDGEQPGMDAGCGSDAGLQNREEERPRSRAMGPHADPTKTYNHMASTAFIGINPHGLEATSSQLCDYINNNPEFAGQLDWSVAPGKRNAPRWKHGIRSALYASPLFIKTDRKVDGEVVWQLDVEALRAAKKKDEEKKRKKEAKRASKAELSAKFQAEKAAMVREKIANINERKHKVRRKIASKKCTAGNTATGTGHEQPLRDASEDVTHDARDILHHRHDLGPEPPQDSEADAPVVIMPRQHVLRGDGRVPPQVDLSTLPVPVTLHQIIDLGLSSDQLATLSPEQLAALQDELNASGHVFGHKTDALAGQEQLHMMMGMHQAGSNGMIQPSNVQQPLHPYMVSSYYGGGLPQQMPPGPPRTAGETTIETTWANQYGGKAS